MTELLFPLRAVLAAADHAVAAPDHRQSHEDTRTGTKTAALWLVGDNGLYLTSNGLASPDATGHEPVVYAEGYETVEAKHALRNEIGGDDFLDTLPLLTPHPRTGTVLHTELARCLAEGWDLFLIEINEDTFGYNFARSRPREDTQ